ncbi:MAG: hypothetical protein LUC38_05875 [Oscillospiraceae bacterium]|nr:hypothetical protein [Ruminococcus sp.]MCD8345471.1 hypothetical protein [Oscillospiraceae bacterium]
METQTPKSEKKSIKKEVYIIIALVVVIALLLLFVFRDSLFGTPSGYEGVIEQYFTSISARDFDSYVGTMPTAIASDYEAEKTELGYSNYDYMDELYYDVFDEFGEDVAITLEFGEAERPDDEYIDYFAESYEEIYGESISTSKVYGVYVNANFSGSLSESDIEFECFVLKTGGRWYMVGCDFWTEEE